MSNIKLDFLRPLYDIAVWQFLVMRTSGRTYEMHEVVANLLLKLLDAKPFSHLTDKLTDEEYREKTGHWKKGEPATSKITEWCHDQWRRKNPVLPEVNVNEDNCGLCLPLFGEQMPVCHKCGTPCRECRTELGLELPEELHSAREILSMVVGEGAGDSNPSEEESAASAYPEIPRKKMRLRARK